MNLGLKDVKSIVDAVISLSRKISVHGNKVCNPNVLKEIVDNDCGALLPDLFTASLDSYSQYGEDLIIVSLLRAKLHSSAIRDVTYCDIGSNHPINMSNTYLLYKLGCRGLLIDPNSNFNLDYKKVRPEDAFLNVAISQSDDEAVEFIVGSMHEVSGTNQGFLEDYYTKRKKERNFQRVQVPTMSIQNVFDGYFFEKEHVVLSIDVEGNDLDIIQSLQTDKVKPIIICVEPSDEFFPGTSDAINKTLVSKGYIRLFSTDANDLYVERDFLIN